MSHLVEQSVRSYLQNSLTHCHHYRVHLYSVALNVVVFVVFISVFGLVLWYSYKQKASPYDQYKQQIRDQEYVLSKIRHVQSQKELQREQMASITHLPVPVHG
jgi:hypothetical protein